MKSPDCPIEVVNAVQAKAIVTAKRLGRALIEKDLIISDEAFDIFGREFVMGALELCRTVLQQSETLKADPKVKTWVDFKP